ncbi:MAG: Ppx/GppA family phosphatase [Clostridia bacterium]|nr:Ppx/GppA family phosphatase [Clostridia bacterium]
MKVAAIGIGSNSVRMLLIETEGSTFRRLRRDREGTRLFAGLDQSGNLSQSAMDATIAAVARMAREAREDGAEQVHLFATSATRDAANQAEFAARLLAEAQVELEICSGYREAQLSFLGATDGGYSGVIDIGGGSTEFVVGQGTHLVCAFSCQMGAVRLFQQAPITGHGDLPAVEQLATDILEQKLAHHPTLNFPDRWIGTGGTFTTLAAMVKGIRWTDRTYMHGTRLTLAEVEQQALLLSDMPMEERLQLPGLQPHRADIVVHGICILSAAMKRLGIQEITVSEYGNLDGYLKEKYNLTESI